MTGSPDIASDPLLAFILARLGDEERYADVAQSQRPAPWQHQEHTGVASAARDLSDCTGNLIAVVHGSYVADYLVRHDAARALREAEADRAILSAYERSVQAAAADLSQALRELLLARAAVWQDHPDYTAAAASLSMCGVDQPASTSYSEVWARIGEGVTLAWWKIDVAARRGAVLCRRLMCISMAASTWPIPGR